MPVASVRSAVIMLGALAMSALLYAGLPFEAEVRKSPDQYYWVHKRFKTRPPGEAKLY